MHDPLIRRLASNGKVKSAATRGPGLSWPGSAPQAGAFSGFQYLTVPLVKFTRPADQRAAAVIPSQLDGLRRKERLRELYRQHLSASDADGLVALAAVIGPQAGLEEDTAMAWLTEFAASGQQG